MTAAHDTRTTYRLGSGPLIHAPGMVAWAINGYAFKRDRAAMRRVIVEGWRLSPEAADALLSKRVPYTVDGDAVVFTA